MTATVHTGLAKTGNAGRRDQQLVPRTVVVVRVVGGAVVWGGHGVWGGYGHGYG